MLAQLRTPLHAYHTARRLWVLLLVCALLGRSVLPDLLSLLTKTASGSQFAVWAEICRTGPKAAAVDRLLIELGSKDAASNLQAGAPESESLKHAHCPFCFLPAMYLPSVPTLSLAALDVSTLFILSLPTPIFLARNWLPFASRAPPALPL